MKPLKKLCDRNVTALTTGNLIELQKITKKSFYSEFSLTPRVS